MKRFFIIGQDARTRKLAKLMGAQYDVYFHCANEWGQEQNELVTRFEPDAVIFPMQPPTLLVTTGPFKEYPFFVGQLTADWQQLLQRPRSYINNEKFLWENAALTAQSFIMHLWQEHVSIANQLFLIAGFGRVGKMVAFYLQKLGAEIHITSSDETQLAEANVYFYQTSPLHELREAAPIVVNTIPAQWLTANNEQLLQSKLYDLASAPGCLQDVAHRNYEHLLNLPARYLPNQAAQLIKNAIEKHIKEEESC